MAASHRPSEQGFILIAAIWMLILCGAIAALLLARSLVVAREASAEAEALKSRLALDAAIETVLADLLINGNRSSYSSLPAENLIELGETRVSVRLVSEAGKVDVNQADPRLIERVLMGLGWDRGERAAFLRDIGERRAERRPFQTMDEIRIVAPRPLPAAPCLDRYFTIYSGRAEPDPALVDAQLARYLGISGHGGSEQAGIVRPGSAIRISAWAEGGSRSAIVRLGGLLDQPVLWSALETTACES